MTSCCSTGHRLRRIGLLAALLYLAIPSLGYSQVSIGWRWDGTGTFQSQNEPLRWSETRNILWQRQLGEPSNATPIIMKKQVITMVEPNIVMALDRRNGKTLWSKTIRLLDTLRGPQRERVEARVRTVQAAYNAQEKHKRKLYRMKRLDRRGRLPPEEKKEMLQMEELIHRTNREWEELRLYVDPPPIEWIGYTSASPLVHRDHIYVVLGTAVVAKLTSKGRVLWQIRVGKPSVGMKGFQRGNAASPVMAGDVLVIGMSKLYGVNPRNGKVLWEGPRYMDYGTPGVMKVGKRFVVITSSGLALDAKTGRVLAKDLGDIWFSSPIVKGDRVYFAGSVGPEIETSSNEVEEHKIVPSSEAVAKVRTVKVRGIRGGKLDWKVLWETQLLQDNYFSSPATDGTTLYVISHRGHLTAVNLKNGKILYHESLRSYGYDDVYASPLISKDRLLILESHGAVTSVDKGRVFKKLSFNELKGRYIACGFLRDGQLALRSDDRIILVGSR